MWGWILSVIFFIMYLRKTHVEKIPNVIYY